jgi:hypothetical protein
MALGIRCYERTPQARAPQRGQVQPTKNVIPLTGLWLVALEGCARKVMVVRYFAETKGVVGCLYTCRLVLKVRDLRGMRN